MLCSTVLLIMRPQQFPCYSPFSLPPRSLESAFIAVYGGQKAKEKKTSRNGPLDAPSAFQRKPKILYIFLALREKPISPECNLLMLPRRSPGKCSSNTLHQQLPAAAMWSRQCA